VHLVDCVGYVASVLVLLTFYMRHMVPLRVAALCSNLAFLAYGSAMHLIPIVLLHGALIPINGWRLVSALRQDDPSPTALPPSAPAPDEGVAGQRQPAGST
jgi:hypothetical protein